VMLLNNEHKALCLTTSLVNRYHPTWISLDFGVQPLMLGWVAMVNLGSHRQFGTLSIPNTNFLGWIKESLWDDKPNNICEIATRSSH
jgi:hypothetical protein